MRVLIVHNEYGKYSGEEAVVDRMIRMLKSNNHIVKTFIRSSAEIPQMRFGNVRAFFSALYNPFAIRELCKVLDSFKPNVVNIHNLYPLISPAALFSIKRRGIPVVMTIHNYRLMCPTGLFMRDGLPCEECLSGNEWSCVMHNCEHSFVKSSGYALRNWVARVMGAYSKCVTCFACITAFQREKLIAAGFDSDKVVVLPNFMESFESNPYTEGDYVAFSGRLSYEKGVDMILEVARRHPEIPFRLAGEIKNDIHKPQIARLISELPNVHHTGYLEGKELAQFYQNSRMVVIASRWYEGFPMSILDASSHCKPTIAPDIAGFPEIIDFDRVFSPFYFDEAISDEQSIQHDTGLLFTPSDIDDLEQKIVWLWQHPNCNKIMGLNAVNKLMANYSVEALSKRWKNLLRRITGTNLMRSNHVRYYSKRVI